MRIRKGQFFPPSRRPKPILEAVWSGSSRSVNDRGAGGHADGEAGGEDDGQKSGRNRGDLGCRIGGRVLTPEQANKEKRYEEGRDKNEMAESEFRRLQKGDSS